VASQASVDEGEVNKTVPYLLGYLAPLTVLGFTLWGSISSRGKVFKGWRQWAIYFAVFFIITAAIVAGSRMYNPVSGVCSEYGDFGKQTWIPFLFAALATVTIIGCGVKEAFFNKSNDDNATPGDQSRNGSYCGNQTPTQSYNAYSDAWATPNQQQAPGGSTSSNQTQPRHWGGDAFGPPNPGARRPQRRNRYAQGGAWNDRRLLQEKFDPTGLPTTLGVLLLICFLSYLYFKGSLILRKSVYKVYIVKKPPTFVQGKYKMS